MNQMPQKPSTVLTVVKAIVALLFIAVAFDMDDMDTLLVSLVIGLAFAAWAFLPYRRYQEDMADAAAGRTSTMKKPGIGLTVFKACLAMLFIIMAFDMDDFSSFLISLVIGAALLFWTVLPYFRFRRSAVVEEIPVSTAVEKPRPSNSEKRKKHRPCPYCGAPMSGDTCEYCGMSSEE